MPKIKTNKELLEERIEQVGKMAAPSRFADKHRSLCAVPMRCAVCQAVRYCRAVSKRRQYGWRSFRCESCGHAFNKQA